MASSWAVQAQEDWGSSLNLLLKSDWNDRWFVISRLNLAGRSDNEELFLQYTGASVGYQLSQRWSGRLGYRYARFRIRDEWRSERRPIVELYYANRLYEWRVTGRSRVEFRSRDWSDNDVRVRQEFTITAPWTVTRLGMKPFIEEELFYSRDNDWVEANWATLGFSFFPAKGAKVKVGYRNNRFRLRGDITTRHTLVAGINLFF